MLKLVRLKLQVYFAKKCTSLCQNYQRCFNKVPKENFYCWILKIKKKIQSENNIVQYE